MEVERGQLVLQRLLTERTTDLRQVGVAEFQRWLDRQLPGWRRDAVFAQRERVRDLRGACPRLRAVEKERKQAAAADAESPEAERLGRVAEELHGVEQAVAGLAGAMEGADAGRRAALRAKLAAFQARREALEAERDARSAASPARARLLRADDELRRLRRECGVEAEEARLAELLRAQGRRSGRAGGGFEEAALRAVREHVVPELGEPAVVLTGVRLGAAGIELDQVVVRPARGGAEVEVLAVVEAKHNPNDVGHGFSRREADLAWLTGNRAAYDPARRVTRHFPTGHFDRPAMHEQDGARFLFGPASFRAGAAGLYFVTRAAPLAGLATGALGRLRHRAATDGRFAPADPAYLHELLAWCRTLAGPVEAPDVVARYAADPARARQILLLP